MKNRVCSVTTAGAVLAVLWGCAYGQADTALTVDEVIARVEAVERVPFSISRFRETITVPSGGQRVFEVRAYAADSMEKQLHVFEKPARVRGEKILMLGGGDDIWSYSPKTGRVRHVATHMRNAKVMGSDFSYQDFGTGRYAERFSITMPGEEQVGRTRCYRLELVPLPGGPGYAKMVSWVGKGDFVVRRVDFHDRDGLLKTLLVTEVRSVDGRPVPWSMVMRNVRDGGETRIETLEMNLTDEPDPALFTQEGLKR